AAPGAPRRGTPAGRSPAGEVRLQRVEPALEDLAREEPLPVTDLVTVAVERRPPLDEAPVAVRDRRDADRRAVVVDVERVLLEVVRVRAVLVRMGEQLLAQVRAVREREAADAADLVARLALLD